MTQEPQESGAFRMDIASDQTIFRAVKDRDYSVIKNTVFRDTNLSWEARGVLGYILTKPDTWQVRPHDLVNQGPAGRDAIRSILGELREKGYMERVRIRQDDGTFQWITNVYETPLTAKPPLDDAPEGDESPPPVAAWPSVDKPAVDKPAMDKPAMDKPAMDKPAMDKPAMGNAGIYERLIPSSTESSSIESPPPRRRGGGGSPSMKGDPPPTTRTPTEAWLRSEGVSRTRAHMYRAFSLDDARAEFQALIGAALGAERERLIGRLMQRWEARPPREATAANWWERPEYAGLVRLGSDTTGLPGDDGDREESPVSDSSRTTRREAER